jgi:hypothetical protein
MTSQETSSYITHHLKIAGRSDPLFSDDATTLIHQTSRGLPRAASNLAIQALIAAYASRKAIVDQSSARAAAAEVTSDRPPGRHHAHQGPAGTPPAGPFHTPPSSSRTTPPSSR